MWIKNMNMAVGRWTVSLATFFGLAVGCQTDQIRGSITDDETCQVCAHTHDAAEVVSGKLNLERIPMGPGSELNADLVDGYHADAFRKQNDKIPWADIEGAPAPQPPPTLNIPDGKFIENRDENALPQTADIHVSGAIVAKGKLETYADAYVGGIVSTATSAGGWGNRLHLRGGPDVSNLHDSFNSDDISLARYNAGTDVTELRVTIGDNANGHRSLLDKFVIGAYAYGVANYPWVPLFSVNSYGEVISKGSMQSNGTPDLAETISAAPNVEAADVVCADPRKSESVRKCGEGGASRPLGVISDGTSAFMILAHGESLDAKVSGKPLVLAGRVPVKVTMEGGPIEIGDELAPASRPGYAKKATKPGVVIGIALAPSRHENSKVLTMVKVGNGGMDALVAENTELKARLSRLEASVQKLLDGPKR